MWVYVLTSEGGTPITNATFSYAYANNGNGWYYVFVGANTYVLVSASGRNSQWIYSDFYSAYYVWLTKYVPPPPSGGNCWS